MNRQTIATLLVVGALVLAGCSGGVQTTAPGTSPTDADQQTTAAMSQTDGGTVSFYISDERNDIDDFDHLNVTLTQVGFERGVEGGWIEREIDNATVDLTQLQGPNATLIDEYDLPNGNYSKVFVYVSEVDGTLSDGSDQRVKLPSGKLQLTEGFTVENGSEIDFVFDITVRKAGNSGKYILKPVISESGTDVPIEADDEETETPDDEAMTETPEDDETQASLDAAFIGNVTQGENATVGVARDGEAVGNATVTVNGETVGTTDADGTLTFTVPDAETLDVTVTDGQDETELEREFES